MTLNSIRPHAAGAGDDKFRERGGANRRVDAFEGAFARARRSPRQRANNCLWDFALIWSTILAALLFSACVSAQVPARALQGVTAIASGEEHSCAIANGAVWCWGSNSVGQLGSNGSTSPLFNATAVSVPEIAQGATAVSVGFRTSCAVVNGGVKCWGANSSSELGTGKPRNNDSNPVPVSVGIDAGATAVSVGSSHVCAIVNDGVSCWGFNEFGKVGNGSFGGFVATPVTVIPANSGVKSISAGDQSSCAVVGNAVKCWGRNKSNEGYLFGNGDPSDDNYNTATDTGFGNDNDVVTLGGATIAFACAYSLATKKVKCSGRNVRPLTDSKTPVELSGADYTFEKLVNTTGRASSLCGLSVSPNLGTVKCWGSGEDILVNIADATNVASVAVGGSHKCVATTEGYAKCWGTNSKGQLGAGRATDSAGNSASAVFVVTDGFTVTPVLSGAGGTIFPNTAFTVAAGAAGTIELRPDNAFVVDTATPKVPADCDAAIAADKKTVAVTRKADTVTNCEVTIAFKSNAVTYTVTSSIDATLNSGTIDPLGAQTVAAGGTPEFRASPNDASLFRTDWSSSTCSRDVTAPIDPSVFKTQAINADCTVIVKFVPFFSVTPSVVKGAGSDGSIDPSTPVTVDKDGTTTFSARPFAGSVVDSWTGTCGGSDAASADKMSFTTNPVTANCTVIVNYKVSSVPTFTITSSVDPASPAGSGTIDPSGDVTVAQNATKVFTATATAGNVVDGWAGTCGGSDAANADKSSFTTNAITANCTVIVKFKAVNAAVKTYTAPSPTANAGDITASFTGGDAACTYKNPRYVPVTGGVGSPATPPPAGVQFPYGLFDFTVEQCKNGDSINFTITYPGPLPPNTRYYKFGPTPTNATPSWYEIPATVNGNTVSFTLTDGAIGDDDLQANGIIVDAGGPGFIADVVDPGNATAVPTLGQWALLLLAMLLAGACAPALLRTTNAPRANA
jgi:trimeric autotransporter adhesin